ncbi:flagellar hook-associated protein FlgK [Mariprofundus sp. EBB-1]|uniref:flagellar hook-associated protein FlgK n=1 Tax=Mariprofundus sp. EBB-1 TaxID=2650971 RepID=UPI000EF1D8A8|nr:flagellar hook-associated protein FlgK [Mariprofundus sp. EBB-1]RLL55626.1 flagellar hook-associated protein FlgK [Mariprofundus sp. EBB-1]
MIFDSLNIAASSLKAQQKSMDVVSHNISNVNTPGYSRQSANLVTATPEKIGATTLGRGVNVNSVQRKIDPIINQAQLNNGTQLSYWTTMNTGLNAVENVFGSLQSTGLASSLDDFFLSWKQLANNPQDNGQRVNVRAKSNALVSNITNMHTQLVGVQATTDSNIDQSIANINQALTNIASLTSQIRRQESTSQGGINLANDQRDQRDQAVRDLAALLPVQSVTTGDGSFMIQTLNGDLLTQDGVARQLARGGAVAGGFSSIVIAGTSTPVLGTTQGGEIGGLLDLRDNQLGNYITQIDSIAANLIFSVNQIHANSSNAVKHTALSSGQSSQAIIALDDASQTAPFAAKVQTGSFNIHVFDAAGAPVVPGGIAIPITAGATTMNQVATTLNAVAGINATVDADGRLSINAAAGQSFALSDDTSNFLAAYEINNFFTGGDGASLSVSAAIQANASAINTGRIDPTTSIVQSGDNSSALAILALQDTPLSVDATTSSSLHNRTTALSVQYGSDVTISKQQKEYRTVEASSLESQRLAISGVNIDEELISMIKFQRAYEASAKIITTTNQMLDSLLGLIR